LGSCSCGRWKSVAEAAEDGIAAAAEKGHPRMECRKGEIISPLDIWSKFWHPDGWLLSIRELKQEIITRLVSFIMA
jgi:hypothetical protein